MMSELTAWKDYSAAENLALISLTLVLTWRA
jgi:hypothetical protein